MCVCVCVCEGGRESEGEGEGGAYAHIIYMECLILVGKTFASLKFLTNI